jgi:hypothetical protein
MYVECDIEGIDPQPILFEFFERVLKYALQQVAIDSSTIGRVIIVSPGRFSAAVASLNPGAISTNTNTYVAAGKTLMRWDGDRVISDMVLQSSLFGALSEVLSDPPSSTEWGVEQQQAIYIICHECGHALDFMLRNGTPEIPDPRTNPFSVRETADYYATIVLDEYAACRNAVSVMTDPLFNYEMQEAGKRMTECARQVRWYLDTPGQLTPTALAHFVCQGTWLMLAELSKQYGHSIHHTNRKAVVHQLEAELVEETPLGDTLDRIENTYPNWNTPDLVADLATVWQGYTRLFSVRFISHEDRPDEIMYIA